MPETGLDNETGSLLKPKLQHRLAAATSSSEEPAIPRHLLRAEQEAVSCAGLCLSALMRQYSTSADVMRKGLQEVAFEERATRRA
jgi:hypothetical protein